MAETTADAGFIEGVPCWIDVQLPDVEAGKRFYGGLFGWRFEVAPGDGARELWAYLGEDPVAALAPKPDGRMPTVWTLYFATPDAVGLAGRIVAAGGQVVIPPTSFGDLGTTALVTDAEGAVFRLWEPGTHTGFRRRHEPGTFVWAELYTRDTQAANSFYAHLFHDALFGPDARPDFGRAPLTEVFPAEMPPHFLVHFGTDDVEAALETVGRLGGRVQVPPFETSYGNVAVVTDNQGASFALLRRRGGEAWREPDQGAGRAERQPDELRRHGDDPRQRDDDLRLRGDDLREDEG
ncbi:VOC family protein [Streptomyces ipomoeae]|uniref:VOC family protein n=1 Tax=Streptomyces ipomoeae TaxID=103232 RepID=UPI0011479F5A|nr:VOC family protein [Streptomyces ipomoeae]MDX2932873.1 VOC family protein [Streptomyces ipomoeae]TQE16404.1 VOC family protein [Streptomyces ipomoeae]